MENNNQLLEKAICFAVKRHSGATRKGTNLPYIIHPLESMQILAAVGADINLMIAGVLHDTVEDTNTTLEEIEELFGTDVAELVASNSEDKTKSWDERKAHTIEYLKTAPFRNRLLIFSDKLANQRSIYRDYVKIGEKLWERFNAPAEKQAWYYSEVQDTFYDFQDIPEIAPLYWEMVNTYKDVFVKYYYDKREGKIYQRARYGYVSYHRLDVPGWIQTHEDIDWDKLVLIERYQAEKAEDNGNDYFWEVIRDDVLDDEFSFASFSGYNIDCKFEDGDFSMSAPAKGSPDIIRTYKLGSEEAVKMCMHLRRKYGLDNSIAYLLELEFMYADIDEHFPELVEEIGKIE